MLINAHSEFQRGMAIRFRRSSINKVQVEIETFFSSVFSFDLFGVLVNTVNVHKSSRIYAEPKSPFLLSHWGRIHSHVCKYLL
jgi:hypothetical protein